MSEELAAIELTIAAEEAGERLDKVLSARPLGLSRSVLQSWMADGRVLVDGVPARASAKVKAGAKVVVHPAPPPPSDAAPQDIPLDVLYEDEHLFVIDKPAGLVVHPGAGNPDGTLVNALLHRDPALASLPRAGIVHRLDKDTSGVMVVARTLQAQTALVERLAARDVHRQYLAVVVGALVSGFVVRVLPLRWVTLIGLGLSIGGLWRMSTWTTATPITEIAIALAVFGLGFGLTVTPRSTAAVEAVGRAHFGMASATVTVARMIGMAVGLAILVAYGSTVIESRSARPAAHASTWIWPIRCAWEWTPSESMSGRGSALCGWSSTSRRPVKPRSSG